MTAALVIQDLSKVYENGFRALDNISFEVEAGDFFALLGPNGAGKSTTLGIVSSLVNKTAGNVKIFGHDLATELSEAKRSLGVVPQEFNFNQFEKVEDILITQAGYYGISADTAKARTETYLKKLGLWDKRHSQSRMLSGGMKRRLMIARALVHNPKLLILDEPTAGVDIELRRSMWAFLREINAAGTTIILTTHYLEEAESLCRNIAIIDKGQIVQNTSMKALLQQLNTETFILDLKTRINTCPNIADYRCRLQEEGASLLVEVKKLQGLNGLFSQLVEQGIEVVSMRSQSNRLEELFVSIVEQKSATGGGMSISELWIAFSTILVKEVRRFTRIWAQTLLPPAITMTLYFIIFGNLIGSRIGEMGGFNYMEFIVPGLIMMSVITNSYNNVVSSFYSTKFQRNIEELLVSPVPNWVILAGYVAGGVTRGLLVGLIVTLLSLFFTQLQVHHLGITVAIVALTAVLFSIGGFINALFANSFDDISIIPTFILTPLTYLGGVFYSIQLLPEFWQGVSQLNPILYMVNGFRYGILGVSDIHVGFAFVAILLFTCVLFAIALKLLNMGKGIRN